MLKAPTQAAIARSFGVSRERVGQLVKEGMPTNSIKAAKEWRKKRGIRRRPTNNSSAMLRIIAKKKVDAVAVPRTGDTLWDALQSTILVQEQAFEMVQDAIASRDAWNMTTLLGVHNKAVEARMKAEEAYREELERRNVLVPWNEATELMRKGLDVILNRLRRLPQKAQACNTSQPLIAFEVLQEESESIIAAARQEYTAILDAKQTTSSNRDSSMKGSLI